MRPSKRVRPQGAFIMTSSSTMLVGQTTPKRMMLVQVLWVAAAVMFQVNAAPFQSSMTRTIPFMQSHRPSIPTRRAPFMVLQVRGGGSSSSSGSSSLENQTTAGVDNDDEDDDSDAPNEEKQKVQSNDDEEEEDISTATTATSDHAPTLSEESFENGPRSTSSSNNNTTSETSATNDNNDNDDEKEEEEEIVQVTSSLPNVRHVVAPTTDDPPLVAAPAVVETTTTTVLDHEHDGDSMLLPSSLKTLDNDIDLQQQQVEPAHDSTKTTTTTATTAATASIEPLTPDQIAAAIEQAGELRTLGKELHDHHEFAAAATQFAGAADALWPVVQSFGNENDNDDSDDYSVVDDYATCRLHAALCFLKAGNYKETIQACTNVLDFPSNEASSSSSSSSSSALIEPALRARAFHRRAKAQVELGNAEAALEDARSAAFLGDRRAVALYGKLMRESSSLALANGGGSDNNSFAASNALFESLLNKSTGASMPAMNSDSLGDIGNIFPSSLFSMMGAGAATGGSGENGAGSLAKSVLSSLSKRLHEESTQDQICTYLQSTSGPQLQQMASLAGIEIPETQAKRLASFCNGVTPKTIQRTLRTTKVVYFIFKMVRKLSQLISKYRSIIILIFLVGWIKSAILRPLPVNKKAARIAAKQATKAAAITVAEAM